MSIDRPNCHDGVRANHWSLPQRVTRHLLAAWRTAIGAAKDDFGMVASSIAFSSFLSLLPLLALTALAYGTFREPQQVVADLQDLIRVIPAGARGFIDDWVSETLLLREGRGAGFIISLALLIYSASRAGRSLLYGLNVACRVDRRRGFFARRATSVLIVLAAACLIIGTLIAVSAFAFVVRFLPEVPFASQVSRFMFWSAAALGAWAGLTAVYRYGPARKRPSWEGAAPGAVVATGIWLAATGLLSLYLEHFDRFGTVYGSLGAIVLFQFWLLGSAMAFLLGARFNVELAREEAQLGDDQPLDRWTSFGAPRRSAAELTKINPVDAHHCDAPAPRLACKNARPRRS